MKEIKIQESGGKGKGSATWYLTLSSELHFCRKHTYPETIRQHGGSDHLILGNFSLELLICCLHKECEFINKKLTTQAWLNAKPVATAVYLIKQNLVVDLLLELALGPFLQSDNMHALVKHKHTDCCIKQDCNCAHLLLSLARVGSRESLLLLWLLLLGRLQDL